MRDGKEGKVRAEQRQSAERDVRGGSAERGATTLAGIGVGEGARISALGFEGRNLRRLIDLGFCRGATVRCVGESPMGDPRAYEVRGAVVAIRRCDAVKIRVTE